MKTLKRRRTKLSYLPRVVSTRAWNNNRRTHIPQHYPNYTNSRTMSRMVPRTERGEHEKPEAQLSPRRDVCSKVTPERRRIEATKARNETVAGVTELLGLLGQKLGNLQKWTIIGIQSSRPGFLHPVSPFPRPPLFFSRSLIRPPLARQPPRPGGGRTNARVVWSGSASPRFCFLGFLPGVAFFFFFCCFLLLLLLLLLLHRPPLCQRQPLSLPLSLSLFLPSSFSTRSALSVFVCFMAAPLRVSLSLSLSRSSSFSFTLSSTHLVIHRCTQASTFLRSPSIAAKATLCTPHSCGIAPGRASFYNPVPRLRGEVRTSLGVRLLLHGFVFFLFVFGLRLVIHVEADSFRGEGFRSSGA